MPTFRTTVRITHPVLGGTATNTWHARCISITPVGALADLNGLGALLTAFYTPIVDVTAAPAAMVWDGIWQEVDADDPDDPMTIEGTGFETTGGASGDALPPQSSICVGWRTASGGRSGRGRTFLGPHTTSALDGDGTIATAALAGVRTAAETLVEDSDSFGNGAFGVFSRDAGGIPPAPVFRDFVSTATRDQFASLRSRRD